MNEQLKKIFLIGLGTTVASKEKAEKIFSDLSKNGNAAVEEARVYLSKLNDKGKVKKEQWQKDFREEAKDTIRELGFVTVEEYEKLEKRLESLEMKLAAETPAKEGQEK